MQHNSEYTKGNTVIATNQSNYPVLIEVYEIDADADYIKFASNLDYKMHTNKLYYDGKADTYYFNHYGVKYRLNETMTVY